MIEKIADLVHEKKLEGISDIRDESAKEEIRIVIELKKGENADIILNNLYKMTQMQTSFGVNAVAIVNGAPRVLNLKQFLEVFYAHRREVLLRRTAYELRKAEERGHILEGLKIAVENIDANEDGTEIRLGFAEWQTVQAVQMLLARFGRMVAEPEHHG